MIAKKGPGRPKGAPNKEKKQSMTRQVQVRLPDDVHDKLGAEAASEGVFKLSTWIRMILIKYARRGE